MLSSLLWCGACDVCYTSQMFEVKTPACKINTWKSNLSTAAQVFKSRLSQEPISILFWLQRFSHADVVLSA